MSTYNYVPTAVSVRESRGRERGCALLVVDSVVCTVSETLTCVNVCVCVCVWVVCIDKLQRWIERWQQCLVDNKTRWQERAITGPCVHFHHHHTFIVNKLSKTQLNMW